MFYLIIILTSVNFIIHFNFRFLLNINNLSKFVFNMYFIAQQVLATLLLLAIVVNPWIIIDHYSIFYAAISLFSYFPSYNIESFSIGIGGILGIIFSVLVILNMVLKIKLYNSLNSSNNGNLSTQPEMVERKSKIKDLNKKGRRGDELFLQNSQMPCPSCGESTESDWDSCPACGNNLKSKKCPNCEGDIKKYWIECPKCRHRFIKFCNLCGTKIHVDAEICRNCGEKA